MPKFTEGLADKLHVPTGARDVKVFDDELPGFGIRKFAMGHASYFVKYNVGRQQRRKTLGKVVRGNLKAMRLEASAVLAKARLGTDVVAVARAAAARPTVRLAQLVPLYLKAREAGDDRLPKLREKSLVEVSRYLAGTERTPAAWNPLHDVSLEAITTQDITTVLDDLARRSGKVTADRARMALSGLYAWAIQKRYVHANPTLGIGSWAQNGARERVLSEAELVEVWKACEDIGEFGSIVRPLMLTGQRRAEIGDLAWSEIDTEKRQIDLPEHRTKNGRPHIIPLSAAALRIINSLPRSLGRELVFGRGVGGFGGWSKSKAELDTRIAAGRKSAGVKKPMGPWVLHDLRRSFVTHLCESGFGQPYVVEIAVNHVSGHQGGVAGIYNKSTYLPERRRALDLWGEHIAALSAGGKGKVLAMRA
jgi:integrase